MTLKNKQKLIKAALPYIEMRGWTLDALKECAETENIDFAEFTKAFPKDINDILSFIHSDVTAQMLKTLEKTNLTKMKVKDRMTLAVMTRFKLMKPYQAAFEKGRYDVIKRGLLATKILFTICDAMWHGIGDTSTDFSYYTKRLSLATIYGSTFSYWLTDTSPDFVNTAMFFERRLGDLAIIPKTKAKINECVETIMSKFMTKN